MLAKGQSHASVPYSSLGMKPGICVMCRSPYLISR